MKKTIILILSLAISIISVAQYGYRFEIKQVFPKNASVYSNAFNFKREMDNDISAQTAKLNGNSNYQILVTTPSGKETRSIQNITWVQTVNGTKTYHKKQTSPKHYYDAATVWEGYSCNIDGSRKGKALKKEFIYRVAFADTLNDFKTAFVDEESADAEALRLFSENVTNDRLVEVVVYKFENNEVVEYDRKTNKEQYEALIAQNEEKKAQKAKEAKNEAIQQQVNQFHVDMEFVHANRDSLLIIGVHYCYEALNKVSKVPESTFLSQKLDSIYLSVLFDDVLPDNDKKAAKARKTVKTDLEALQKEENHTPRNLLKYTRNMESKLNKKNDSFFNRLFKKNK